MPKETLIEFAHKNLNVHCIEYACKIMSMMPPKFHLENDIELNIFPWFKLNKVAQFICTIID